MGTQGRSLFATPAETSLATMATMITQKVTWHANIVGCALRATWIDEFSAEFAEQQGAGTKSSYPARNPQATSMG